jgi:hypothetical protein
MFSPKANGRGSFTGDRIQIKMSKTVTRKRWGDKVHFLRPAAKGLTNLMLLQDGKVLQSQILQYNPNSNTRCTRTNYEDIKRFCLFHKSQR